MKTVPLCLALLASALCADAQTGGLPSDVRPDHWAAVPVQEVLRNRVMSVQSDKEFHGEAKVTHTQAVIALARLARTLEDGVWQPNKSVPVEGKKVDATMKQGDWAQQPISRFTLAKVLARFGDYVTNGLTRPAPGSKDVGKSEALPPPVSITVSPSSPAYEALTYLAKKRMIGPGSPLLKPDDKPIRAVEMSRALSDVVVGLNDRLTEIGHDENGNTPDSTFQKKPAPKK